MGQRGPQLGAGSSLQRRGSWERGVAWCLLPALRWPVHSPHRESPCPAGPQPPSWSYANTLGLLPSSFLREQWCGALSSPPSLSVGLLPLPAGTPQLPVPRLTRSRPKAETPEIGLISLSPEPREVCHIWAEKSSPFSAGKGKAGRERRGPRVDTDQWGPRSVSTSLHTVLWTGSLHRVPMSSRGLWSSQGG